MIMNHYRVIDKKRIQFDFLTHRPEDGAFDAEITRLGGRVFHAPRLMPWNLKKYHAYMNDLLGKYDYGIIHSHIDALSALPLSVAKSCGVPVRIAHSHSSSVDFGLRYPVKMVAKNFIPLVATDFCACSNQAGDFLFGRKSKYRLLRNAIDLEHYRFSAKDRVLARREMGIDPETKLLCHVGRFVRVKNQAFLVRLLCDLRKVRDDVELVFVGDGELREKTEVLATSLNVAQYIHFLGELDDVNPVLQAADVFVFPSHYEGIPLALIEAQSAGLPVIASDRISPDALIREDSIAKPLDVQVWVGAVQQCLSNSRPRASGCEELASAGYDINLSSAALSSYYEQLHLRGQA